MNWPDARATFSPTCCVDDTLKRVVASLYDPVSLVAGKDAAKRSYVKVQKVHGVAETEEGGSYQATFPNLLFFF